MGFNLLYTLQPLSKIFPKVPKPNTPIDLHVKTIYTAITLFVYLICSQIPLYGIARTQSTDPFYWTRVILASSRGTLMELGISPVISASWAVQFAGLMGLFKADLQNQRDARIYTGVEKVLAMLMAFGTTAGQIWYGAYGPVETLGISNILVIIGQLMFAAFLVILLDDMLQSGYGLGSGISLFIVANTAENIFWKMFSPVTLSSQFGIQFQGSFLCMIHFLLTKPTRTALYLSLTRTSAPNLCSFLGTVLIFFIVIYLQGVKMQIPLIHQHSRGFKYNFKVKLFFTSTISIILQSMFSSKIYGLSQVLHQRFKNISLVNWLGVWQGDKVISGLAYWISPPQTAINYLSVRGATYTVFVCAMCALFSQMWLVISKETPRELAKKFRQQELTMADYRNQSVYEVLRRYVPTAAMLGGIVIGLLTILGDLMNVIGSSTGILLAVNIIYGYYDKVVGNGNKTAVSFY